MAVTPEEVLEALAHVVEPESGRDIVRLGIVRGLAVTGKTVVFTVLVPSPTSDFAATVARSCREAVAERLGSDVHVHVEVDSEMIPLGDEIQVSGGGPGGAPLELNVRNLVAVASGKGGVGKSTVAVNLAVALARNGYDVGLVDTDIYGPSVPTMFGVTDEKPRVSAERRILPLNKYGVKLLSMGFMVDPSDAVIWRGPMVSSAVRQFLGDTEWGELDYLIMDLPPGTGDIQLTIVQTVALTGAVIVSTPQRVALADARKGVSMFRNVNVPVLGMVENMAYFTPPDLPDRKYFLFGDGGARALARELDVPILAEIPIEQILRETGDAGTPIVVAHPDSQSAKAFDEAAKAVVRTVNLRNATQPPTQQIEILHR